MLSMKYRGWSGKAACPISWIVASPGPVVADFSAASCRCLGPSGARMLSTTLRIVAVRSSILRVQKKKLALGWHLSYLWSA